MEGTEVCNTIVMRNILGWIQGLDFGLAWVERNAYTLV